MDEPEAVGSGKLSIGLPTSILLLSIIMYEWKCIKQCRREAKGMRRSYSTLMCVAEMKRAGRG